MAERLGVSAMESRRAQRLPDIRSAGLFARDLAECLALQLRARDRLDPAMAALLDNLELLARRDFQSLKRICGVDEEDLLDMLAEIRTLDPKPGTGFEAARRKRSCPMSSCGRAATAAGRSNSIPTRCRAFWSTRLLCARSHATPREQADHAFLTECLQTANWLTRSLDQRAKTIMKVATEIVRQQDAFLIHGVDHLRPLNLKTVADAIKMHESTVSRVTSNKYMLTPRGAVRAEILLHGLDRGGGRRRGAFGRIRCATASAR